MNHTPTPWHINGYDSENGTPAYISGKGGEPVLAIHRLNPDAKENARHIVHCVNTHDALVEALREIAKGEGAYSLDPLKHASNTISNMQEIALRALAQAEKGAS